MHIRQIRGWLVRLFGMFQHKQREREFAEELESHLALHTEDNLRAGLSPEEARRLALIKLGGVTLTQERYHEQRGLPMLETFWQDLRFGLRMLRKNSGFTLIAILTLALGIGANTTIFSVVNAIWLRPLPYPEAERLSLVSHRSMRQGNSLELTPAGYFALRQQSKSFEHVAVYVSHDFNLTGLGEPERLPGQFVSAALFPLLRIAPSAGRVFTEADDRAGAPRVVLLSHELWQRRLGADA